MIKVIFYREKDEIYTGFSAEGHAGYGEYGRDIVCAAVSALVINTVNAIEKFTDNKFSLEQGTSGTIKFNFSSASDRDGQLLLKALVLGITEIYKEHGNDYLQVYFKEV